MTVVLTLIAQVVLTLRSILFGSEGLVLITVERNRIYAVTGKNRIITLCFGVMTMSQFSLGLYMTIDAANSGCRFMTKCAPQFLPMSAFQRDRCHRSRFRSL